MYSFGIPVLENFYFKILYSLLLLQYNLDKKIIQYILIYHI